ncbi:hypothetical protein KKE06_01200 [Candidatus Micrarchaeota archaeon]|nr:hypothetical protein [Candidatus Micrarchaeota archaeon]MBU1930053.1 hypothetical protein [Candidatus Micrarchaeota archaeon]
MSKSRGQSSAPFEVLIAVIIMGFVLLMGIQAIEFLSKQQCKAQIKSEASDLKAAVQNAIRGDSVVLNFFPPQCFDEEREMQLRRVASRASCRSICEKEMDECLFFTYRAEDFGYDLCLDNAPIYTDFLDSSNCQDLGSDYVLIDFLNPSNSGGNPVLERGVYTLQNKTGSAETVPKICAYYYNQT